MLWRNNELTFVLFSCPRSTCGTWDQPHPGRLHVEITVESLLSFPSTNHSDLTPSSLPWLLQVLKPQVWHNPNYHPIWIYKHSCFFLLEVGEGRHSVLPSCSYFFVLVPWDLMHKAWGWTCHGGQHTEPSTPSKQICKCSWQPCKTSEQEGQRWLRMSGCCSALTQVSC